MKYLRLITYLAIIFAPSCKQVESGVGTVSENVPEVDKGKGELFKSTASAESDGQIPEPLSLDLLPKNLVIAEGTSASLTAIGQYPYYSRDLTSHVEWISLNPDIAIFDDPRNKNVISTHNSGRAVVSAKIGEIVAELTIDVISSEVKHLQIDIESAKVDLDPNFAGGFFAKDLTFKLTAVLTNQTITDLTSQSTCTSSKPDVASIKEGAPGVLVAKQPGTVLLRCMHNEKTTEIEITLTKGEVYLKDFVVSEVFVAIPIGTTKSITILGQFSNGETADVTASSKFESKDVTVANFLEANSPGKVRSIGKGNTAIVISNDGITKEIPFATTAAVLTKIEITPKNISQPLGVTTQYTAAGTFSDGTVVNFTSSVLWESSDTPIATVNNNSGSAGLAKSTTKGTTTISASFQGLKDETQLIVTDPTLVRIDVTPPNFTISKGSNAALVATGVYSDGTFADLTFTAKWTSTNAAVASVSDSNSNKGSVKGENISISPVYIRAASAGILGQSQATITAAQVTSVAVTASNPTVPLGRTKQFTASATYTDGSIKDVTSQAKWTFDITSPGYNYAGYVSDEGETKGLAYSIAEGKIRVIASLGVHSAGLDFNVTEKIITHTTQTSTAVGGNVTVDETAQFTLIATFTDNTTLDVTAAAGPTMVVTWGANDSSPNTIATIDNSTQKGLMTAVSPGGVNITSSLATPWGNFNRTSGINVNFDCSTSTAQQYLNYCLVLGDATDSCDNACANAGAVYHYTTRFVFGSDANNAECQAGLGAVGMGGGVSTDSVTDIGVGCGIQQIPGFTSIRARFTARATNAEDSLVDFRRLCSCEPP